MSGRTIRVSVRPRSISPDSGSSPSVLEIILLALIIYSSGGDTARIFVALLQIATFLLKTYTMCFVYVWVRWTLPRFRYDQLQKLGWQILLPLSLLNIFITSAVVVALS